MQILLSILLVVVGIGVPMYFTAKNSKPENVINHIIHSLKTKPQELWFYYFTRKGLEQWMEGIDFSVLDIQKVEMLDYQYENYVGKLKVKFILPKGEVIYFIHLVKNPDFRAKSRWIINALYKDK